MGHLWLTYFSTFAIVNCFQHGSVGNTVSHFLRQREFSVDWSHLLLIQVFCDAVIWFWLPASCHRLQSMGPTLTLCLAEGPQDVQSTKPGLCLPLVTCRPWVVLALAPSVATVALIPSLFSVPSALAMLVLLCSQRATHTGVWSLAWLLPHVYGHSLPSFRSLLNVPFSFHPLSWLHSFS